eukprot:Seg4868.3 transcript_id=Seg4868.3/GoldUCD/mRNA.D3Y31 product="hypothetical protein" protein_id=Seg4868.3/GoldUCD/D3Y31
MPRPESIATQRRSARATTRASTTSSGVQSSQNENPAEIIRPPRAEAPASQPGPSNQPTNPAEIIRPPRAASQPQNEAHQLEAVAMAFTANQVKTVESIVKASITEAMSELKDLLKQQPSHPPSATNVLLQQRQQPHAANSSVSLPPNLPHSRAPTTLPELMAFERLGATPFATQSDISSFSVDGGFTPEIPQTYVRAIQSGEFFDIAKLLPENLQKMTSDVGDGPLAITMDSNSQLKLVKQNVKKKVETIDDWTNAFTVYMKVVIDKHPVRSRELIEYLDLIRYAARYHHSLGWFIYDNKFRYKAANDRSLTWAKLDQQLWTRIFTVSQSQLEADLALFKQGPSSVVSRAVISAPRDGTCNNYNKGNPCFRNPCLYSHTCNKPGCNEPHPGYICRKQGGKYPQISSSAAARSSNSST